LNAALQLIAPLEAVEFALLLVEEKDQAIMVASVRLVRLLLTIGAADVQTVETKRASLVHRGPVIFVLSQHLAGGGVLDFLLVENRAKVAHQGTELIGDDLVVTRLRLTRFLIEGFAFFLRHARSAAKPFGADDNAFNAAGDFQTVVFDVLTGAPED